MKELTVRQKQILKFIRKKIESTGLPPTRAEISEEFGFKSTNAAEDHLRALAKKGAIEMLSGTDRGIRVPAGYYMAGVKDDEKTVSSLHTIPCSVRASKKYDIGKPRHSLLPKGAIAEVIAVLEYGASKYGTDNWQQLPDFDVRYYDAMMRHVEAWWDNGELNASDSGLPHLAHIACNALFLLWRQKSKKSRDEADNSRPPAPDFT